MPVVGLVHQKVAGLAVELAAERLERGDARCRTKLDGQERKQSRR